MQTREQILNQWLIQLFPEAPFNLTPLAGDASFRRYFRLHQDHTTYVVMDAPPEKEALKPFLNIAKTLQKADILVPTCFEQNLDHGFLLLSDFGDHLLFNSLNQDNTNTSYIHAIDILLKLQPLQVTLPHFDKTHIQHELSLFIEWFLKANLGLSLTNADLEIIQHTFDYLADHLTHQPQVFIHRDYHSRNIMRLTDGRLGLIDFQDAMQGPCAYDLVSLLKDCYLQWPEAMLTQWLHHFYIHSPHAQQLSEKDFIQAFELCGLQRHLKVLGIFSRLALRDNKPHYLNDLPLTLHYVMNCLEKMPNLANFHQFMREKVKL